LRKHWHKNMNEEENVNEHSLVEEENVQVT
jgi:hypothetical protein